jgi:very-short-patch-repair endonuclease
VVTRAQAVALLGRKRLERLVRDGQWQIPLPGVVVAHNGPTTEEQQRWIAVLASGTDAVLAGISAAVAGGLRRRTDEFIHVLMPAHRHSERPRGWYAARVRPHRTTFLPDKDLPLPRRPPRTAMPRSLVDAAQWARSDDEARAIVAAGCQQRLVRPDDVLAVVERMPRARRRALILDTLGMAQAGAMSLPEINFRRLCGRHRLPLPDHQVMRHDRAGRPRYLDAYWAPYQLHVEIDGRWHTEADSWWSDLRRQNDLWIAGDRVLRFPAWLVRERPTEVADQLREALRAAGWRSDRQILTD